MSKVILVLLAMLPLAGCAGMRQEMARMDDQTCQSYGARPGTDMYTKCRLQLRAEARGGGGGGGTTAAVPIYAPVECTTMPGLGGMSTTSCR
jgi:hypothetical protein